MAGMKKVLRAGYDEALMRVPDALKEEGFGVLTEIDLRSTLRHKIGVDFRRYKILGACNPTIAHQMLLADVEAGLMLPCNVIVYENDERRAVVLAVDPTVQVAPFGNEKLTELAATVKVKLEAVLARLE